MHRRFCVLGSGGEFCCRVRGQVVVTLSSLVDLNIYD